MTEFLIIAPLLLFFCFGTIQLVLLYQAKSTLDVAALEAAREGAVNNGSMMAMQAGLARGLAPLYARQATTEGVLAAQSKAAADLVGGSRISVISPTAAMMSDFAQPRYYPEDAGYKVEIPNDTLTYRSIGLGATSKVNIQDANLLKIRVHYCYNMYVPLINKVIYYATNIIGNIGTGGILTSEPGNEIEFPYGEPKNPDYLCKVPLKDGIDADRWPLPLESEAIVRMQSPYRGQPASVSTNATGAR
ncbi:TadE/TadG family type IV pilus assembly protein [Paraburkholderia sp.]|uniref:TadE family protein n=1 Tax=Paraburkholderia sp. TaxID=1926495 RepID=UPI002381DFE2|nr:TadE/TadG family type IV pilus assembly protein [Paraburkholderia sp.]MDE1182022.1 TadE/TadG family type IV pilus assembly protein [Paraburkholderia sp.]